MAKEEPVAPVEPAVEPAPEPVQAPVSEVFVREPGVNYDPNFGQGGAYKIDENGVRVPA